MGEKCIWGLRLTDGVWRSPQYRVVGRAGNPFKLCDFPLVTPIRLLY